MKKPRFTSASSFIISTILFFALNYRSNADEHPTSEPKESPFTKLACGSCFKQSHHGANDIWETIAATTPQAFLFMGDNIYADTQDMDVMREKYQTLNALPAYAKFSKEIPIIPIWDDHDYGKNDAGTEYPKKTESQQIFLDAFHFPADHPARKQEGVYHSVTQGPEGKITQIINLDTRYHRSKLDRRKVNKKYQYFPVTDLSATILGHRQWRWLEQELLKPADLRIIVSSIQIISDQHRFEKWSNIPLERQRFLNLLKKTNSKRVVLLSGDRHLAEISRLPHQQTGLSYDLLEMTSSGLTHSGIAKTETNPYRLKGSFFNIINFGTLEIDWSEDIPKVTLSIINKEGEVLFQTKTDFKQ